MHMLPKHLNYVPNGKESFALKYPPLQFPLKSMRFVHTYFRVEFSPK